MKVIVDLCLVPLGVGASVSSHVAACAQIISASGLKNSLHANGTNIEGEWDEVFAVIKRCHEIVHNMNTPRIFTSLRVNTRIDRNQTMQDKISSVQSKLKNH